MRVWFSESKNTVKQFVIICLQFIHSFRFISKMKLYDFLLSLIILVVVQYFIE